MPFKQPTCSINVVFIIRCRQTTNKLYVLYTQMYFCFSDHGLNRWYFYYVDRKNANVSDYYIYYDVTHSIYLVGSYERIYRTFYIFYTFEPRTTTRRPHLLYNMCATSRNYYYYYNYTHPCVRHNIHNGIAHIIITMIYVCKSSSARDDGTETVIIIIIIVYDNSSADICIVDDSPICFLRKGANGGREKIYEPHAPVYPVCPPALERASESCVYAYTYEPRNMEAAQISIIHNTMYRYIHIFIYARIII